MYYNNYMPLYSVLILKRFVCGNNQLYIVVIVHFNKYSKNKINRNTEICLCLRCLEIICQKPFYEFFKV